MKRIFTSVLVLMTVLMINTNVNAQNIAFLNPDTTATLNGSADVLETIYDLLMENTASDSLTVNWNLVTQDIPLKPDGTDAWRIQICDEVLCHLNPSGSSQIPPNYVYDWHYQVFHDNNLGTGTGILTVENAADASDVTVVTVDITVEEVVSIEATAIQHFTVYPNPTTDILNVEFEANHGVSQIAIFSTNGQMVYDAAVDVNSTKDQFDIQHLNTGFYQVVFTSADGKVLMNHRIEKF